MLEGSLGKFKDLAEGVRLFMAPGVPGSRSGVGREPGAPSNLVPDHLTP